MVDVRTWIFAIGWALAAYCFYRANKYAEHLEEIARYRSFKNICKAHPVYIAKKIPHKEYKYAKQIKKTDVT